MNATQAKARTQKAILRNTLKGVYDKIGRAADLERYSIATTLPLDLMESAITSLTKDGFVVLKVDSKTIRISWQ